MPDTAERTRPAAKLRVQQRAVSELVPYAQNARTHTDEQVQQIARSIQEFGFTNPVLIAADGTIIAGHGRVLAAKVLGWKEVPTIELAHLTPQQVQAYVIADNRLAELAQWDTSMLAQELGELSNLGFDTDLTGFSGSDIQDLLSRIDAEQVNRGHLPEEKAAMFENATIKQIVLLYPSDEYPSVVQRLESARMRAGLDNNSALLVHLLDKFDAAAAD